MFPDALTECGLTSGTMDVGVLKNIPQFSFGLDGFGWFVDILGRMEDLHFPKLSGGEQIKDSGDEIKDLKIESIFLKLRNTKFTVHK